MDQEIIFRFSTASPFLPDSAVRIGSEEWDMARKRGLQLNDPAAAGQRLASIRAERGFNQVDLAEKLGISQSLVSQYERGELRLNAAMIVELVRILGVSADQILGIDEPESRGKLPSRKLLRRVEQIETLPKRKQEALIQTIDAFLKSAEA